MFILKNGRRDNKSPILLVHLYAKGLQLNLGLLHWLFTFFAVNITDCHFIFHNIDNETFLIQSYISLLLKLHTYDARKYRFVSFKSFLNEIIKIKDLERRIAVNNWNKGESN